MLINTAVFHQSAYLDTDKLELPESECPFCGFSNRQPMYVLQDNPKVLLLLCANCNAASADRMPTNKALSEYYNGYYKSSRISGSDNEVTFDDPSRFGKYLAIKFLEYQNSSDVFILDFGGGDGSISNAVAVELLKRGAHKIDIIVVDYNENTILPQDNRITITKKNILELETTPTLFFNIVIASAVIEHIPKPCDTLYGLLKRLKTGGVFYARTPYMLPMMRLFAYIGIKLDFTYPAHIHDLGQEFWETYFERMVTIGEYRILQSNPSIVQTTFKQHLLKTMAAYFFKAPWYLIGRSYKLVGGGKYLFGKTEFRGHSPYVRK